MTELRIGDNVRISIPRDTSYYKLNGIEGEIVEISDDSKVRYSHKVYIKNLPVQIADSLGIKNNIEWFSKEELEEA